MFEYLKPYVVNDVDEKNEKNDENFIFYPVSEEDILQAETRIGFSFPSGLKQFYREIGYGFMHSDRDEIERIMHPDDIADFICKDEVYAGFDTDFYQEDELVFFHISGDDFLTIRYAHGEEGEVVCFHRTIAPSFEDFIFKMYTNPGYFYQLKNR